MRTLWNRVPLPVWSLSTLDDDGNGNMNICAYVTSISMQPKMIVMAIYHHTKTLSNLKQHPTALLQLLTTSHEDIARTLGHQSGTSFDKLSHVSKKHDIAYHHNLPYLADAAGFMELTFVDFMEVGGDHLLAVAEVVTSKNISDAPILSLDHLRDDGIVR